MEMKMQYIKSLEYSKHSTKKKLFNYIHQIKEEISQINNTTLHLKNLEKAEGRK